MTAEPTVTPLSAEEIAEIRSSPSPLGDRSWGNEVVQRLLSTLDAERAARADAERERDEAERNTAILWDRHVFVQGERDAERRAREQAEKRLDALCVEVSGIDALEDLPAETLILERISYLEDALSQVKRERDAERTARELVERERNSALDLGIAQNKQWATALQTAQARSERLAEACTRYRETLTALRYLDRNERDPVLRGGCGHCGRPSPGGVWAFTWHKKGCTLSERGGLVWQYLQNLLGSLAEPVPDHQARAAMPQDMPVLQSAYDLLSDDERVRLGTTLQDLAQQQRQSAASAMSQPIGQMAAMPQDDDRGDPS